MDVDAEIYELLQTSRSHQLSDVHLRRLTNDLGQRRKLIRISILEKKEEIAQGKNEIAVLKMVISGKEDVMYERKRKVSELESMASAIRERMKVLKALAVTRKHPIRKLPPEILAYILELAVDTNSVVSNLTIARPVSAFLLSNVCSQWREVALRSPRIWAKVSIHFPHHPITNSSYQKAMMFLTTVIKRSRAVPFSVKIGLDCFNCPEKRASVQFTSLVEMLLAHPWRSAVVRYRGSPTAGGQTIGISSGRLRLALMERLSSVEMLEFEDITTGQPIANSHGPPSPHDHPFFDPSMQDNPIISFSNLRTLLLPLYHRPFSTFPTTLRQRILGPHLTTLRICVGTDYKETLETLHHCAASLVSLSLHVLPAPTAASSRLGAVITQSPMSVLRFGALEDLKIVVQTTGNNGPRTYMVLSNRDNVPNGHYPGAFPSLYTPYPRFDPVHPLIRVQTILQSIETPVLESLDLQASCTDFGYPRVRSLAGRSRRESDTSRIDTGPFKEFVKRSGISTSLRKFTFCGFDSGNPSRIGGPTVSDATILEMLETIPGVREVMLMDLNRMRRGVNNEQ
ncbi:hypothetical protein L218DRAFT_951301 [Marasmius fiardii PR-910]|nr:hypothetical protein L218DRAFT_951301 [Marasmius fiardii PR-910]